MKERGHYANSLLDSGTAQNILSANLERKLYLAILSTKKTRTVVGEIMSTRHGIANSILVIFGELKAKMNFSVVDGVSYRELIGIQEMEKLNDHIDINGQYVDSITGKSVFG